MARRKHILIVNGHPDPRPERFVHALSSAYARGAREAGHDVRIVNVGSLEFPLLRTATDFERGLPPPAIAEGQANLKQADHLVVVFPLWLGAMPALLKGYFEQVLRPSFAFEYVKQQAAAQTSQGKVGARRRHHGHAGRGLSLGLSFPHVIGLMGEPKAGRREKWLAKMEGLGRRAA